MQYALIISFLVGLPTAYLITKFIIRYTLRQGILDIPNRRSSHRRPTPRGGGLAIVAVTLAGGLLYGGLGPAAGPPLWIGLLGAGLVAAVSWLDDIRSLSNRLRLAAHSLAAALVIGGVGYWSAVHLPLLGLLNLGGWGAPLTFLWIVGLINAYNFMDGIDGIAGSQAVTAGLGWGISGWLLGQPLVSLLGLLLAAGSLGFLGHNWPPARIFMGDVGSAFLGYCFALLPLLAVHPAAAVTGLLLVWPFVFDSAFTFLRRLRRGENVFKAHRSHLYQRLLLCGFDHQSVTALYTALAIVGLLLGVYWTLEGPGRMILLAIGLPAASLGLWLYVVLQETVLHNWISQLPTVFKR